MLNNIIEVKSLDMDGRGVAHIPNEDGSPGKVLFIDEALPGERIRYKVYHQKKNWESAAILNILKPSVMRVQPQCEYFGICGGCSLQHLESNAQVAIKQRVLEDSLWHLGRVKPLVILRPIYGPMWHYRYRARLSVHYVVKKGEVLVGFHERRSRFIANMKSCKILPAHVSDLLVPLRRLIESLTVMQALPQIELAVTEKATVLVLRIMQPLTVDDEEKLIHFANDHQIHFWLQTKGPDTARPFYPKESNLEYTLPEFNIRMPFKPTDFTQVNHQINSVMVGRALRLLSPQKNERVADFFCGLGNFTLPLATLAENVVGVEGSNALVARAMENAQFNQVADKVNFLCQNLFEMTMENFIQLGKFDRILIDPPRDGAMALCQALAQLRIDHFDLLPKRIVYVSCNPATLARDAGILVKEAGYVLDSAGVMNMFPHTAHVESMAVFNLNLVLEH